jgi:hypothetical protein
VAAANHSRIGVVKVQGRQWKLGSATIGVSAVVAMGVLGGIFGDVGSAKPEQVARPVVPLYTGQSATTTTPPTVPDTATAAPGWSATPPSGFAPVFHP